MKLVLILMGLVAMLVLSGCEVPGQGGVYGGIYGEYPAQGYGYGSYSPEYVYPYPYNYSYSVPYYSYGYVSPHDRAEHWHHEFRRGRDFDHDRDWR